MSISLFALGAAYKIAGGGSALASVIAIGSLMAYVASFAISLGPIFWLLTLAFCWKFVPETKGKRLEDIQEYFQARVDACRAVADTLSPCV
jgi:hypothetical protein